MAVTNRQPCLIASTRFVNFKVHATSSSFLTWTNASSCSASSATVHSQPHGDSGVGIPTAMSATDHFEGAFVDEQCCTDAVVRGPETC